MAGAANSRAPHHTQRLHPPCWRCKAHLGCGRCSGPELDLWCRCGVYQSMTGLLTGGLHGGVALERHPPDWQQAWRAHQQLNPRRSLLELYDAELAKRGIKPPAAVKRLSVAERLALVRPPREPGEEG